MYNSNYSGSHTNRGDYLREEPYAVGHERRPPMSYAELISMAIESSPDQCLTLKEIYTWISARFPYFQLTKTGWQNSIRHNLSLNRCFYKVARGEGNRGKGSYWKINYEFQNVKVNYRSRRYSCYRHDGNTHIESLNEILNDNKLVSENIGVNEIPYKQTTVFHGNLLDNEDMYNTADYYEYNNETKSKRNQIFSFK